MVFKKLSAIFQCGGHVVNDDGNPCLINYGIMVKLQHFFYLYIFNTSFRRLTEFKYIKVHLYNTY